MFCAHKNDSQNRFCTTCGKALNRITCGCGAANASTSLFCGACGNTLVKEEQTFPASAYAKKPKLADLMVPGSKNNSRKESSTATVTQDDIDNLFKK